MRIIDSADNPSPNSEYGAGGRSQLLGYEVAESTVAKYLPKRTKPPRLEYLAACMRHTSAALDGTVGAYCERLGVQPLPAN